MKIVYNRIIPLGKRFYAINLFGILFAKGPCSARMLNHESIHTAQMKELLYIFFYMWYVLEWAVRLLRNGGDAYRAYRNISFEREAYDNEGNPLYLATRKPFSSLRCL